MESIDRASHPSLEQVEALVHYLEEKPHLAKGFLRNQSAKAQAHKEWERIALKLNSIGGGTIKNVKKWIKYWADKKSAVKKKSAARAAARRRTGGGTEVVPVLSEVEERIVALMGGDGFATGDVHLQIQETPPTLPNSPSNLIVNAENTVDQPRPSTSHDYAYQSPHQVAIDLDPLNLNTSRTQYSGIYQPPSNNPDPPPTPAFQASAPRMRSPGTVSSHRIVEEGNATPPHNIASAVSTPRRRRVRLRRSPPAQRRPQLQTIIEKFLSLEEQRLGLERRMVAVLERNSETDTLMAQANIVLGEGLKALAEAIKKD